jgi:hypothetical protein
MEYKPVLKKMFLLAINPGGWVPWGSGFFQKADPL